jgi:hypothetical protein
MYRRALMYRECGATQADAIVSFMHKSGEHRTAGMHAAFVRGTVATAAQEAAEITGVQ